MVSADPGTSEILGLPPSRSGSEKNDHKPPGEEGNNDQNAKLFIGQFHRDEEEQRVKR